MQFSTIAAALMATLATASPIEHPNVLAARQVANEVCNIGYCTQNGGTKGGLGGKQITVSTLDQFKAAAKLEEPTIITLNGKISGSERVRITADTTLIGTSGSSITGVGLYVRRVKNVIIRNLKISGVMAENGDAISIDNSINVWVDHVDVSGNLSAGKDDLDGLIDISHQSDYVSVTHTYFHDHWKGSLIGHSDSATADKNAMRVTYANNYWKNVSSRQPLVRFGTVHIINNYWDGILLTGVNSRMGAQTLITSSVFVNSAERAITSEDSKEIGYVSTEDVVLNGSKNVAPKGTLTSAKLPYKITALGSANVARVVPGQAGQKL